MKAFWNRTDRDIGLEAALRRHRPEPRDEFARELVHRVTGGSRAVRLYAFSRLSFAAAATVLIFGSVASFGGLGYAATSAGQAADSVEEVLVPKKRDATVVLNSPAQAGHVAEVEGERIEVAGATRRQPPPPLQVPLQVAVPQPGGELAFTGLALTTTFALALMLIVFGAFLRRMARARAVSAGSS